MEFPNLLLRRWKVVLWIHLVFVLLSLPGLTRLRTDNSARIYFSRESTALHRYGLFRRLFNQGPVIRISLRGSDIWTPEGLEWLTRLEEETGALEGIYAAAGPTIHHRWLSLEWPPPDPQEFHTTVLADELDRIAGWIGGDGNTVTLTAVLEPLSPLETGRILERIRSKTKDPPGNIRCGLSGLPVFQEEMDDTLADVVFFFLPALFLLSALFLFLVFRRIGLAAVPLLYVSCCQIILFGAMGWLGVRLNLINIILALLLFVIALATAVHLQMRFTEQVPHRSGREAVTETLRTKTKPVIWTGLTTCVAFGSMMAGSIAPVKTLGFWAAAGIALSTLLAFTLIPPLWIGLGSRVGPSPRRPGFFSRIRGGFWALWAVRRRKLIFVCLLLLSLAFALGIPRLEISDNMARYFPRHNPVRSEMERLDRDGLGSASVEMVISHRARKERPAADEETFRTPAALERLRRFCTGLRLHPHVMSAVGAGDILEAASRAILVEGERTESVSWLALGMMQSSDEGRRLLDMYLSQDGRTARITLFVPVLGGSLMSRLIEEWTSEAEGFFPGFDVWITGEYSLLFQAQRKLIRSLIFSLALTLACIAALFLIIFKGSIRAVLILIPNLFPLLCIFGGMGWLKIPLDSVSVLSASLVLGLVVDDTLHSMGCFLDLHPPARATEAIAITLQKTAPAHILTTLILASGFAVCGLIPFLPVSRMGSLSLIAVLIALGGDLLVIPALLGRSRR